MCVRSRDEGGRRRRGKIPRLHRCSQVPFGEELMNHYVWLGWGNLGGSNAASADGRIPGGGPSSPSLPWRWLPSPSCRWGIAVIQCASKRLPSAVTACVVVYVCTRHEYRVRVLGSSFSKCRRVEKRVRALNFDVARHEPLLNIPDDDCVWQRDVKGHQRRSDGVGVFVNLGSYQRQTPRCRESSLLGVGRYKVKGEREEVLAVFE
ncbi:hypothetical protein LX36DRAFT_15783 [Colletotrichum falcatum]|nr:hypothetical protein LX36DRAFT_15783 [Colletotrichum falcatum]